MVLLNSIFQKMFSLKIKIAVKKIEFNPICPCFVRNFLSGGSGPEWQIWEAHGGWVVPFTPGVSSLN